LPNLVMEVVGKIFALALSAGLAWLTGSYWSLAVGTIASPVIMLVVSYIYAPFVPAISLRKWHDFATYVRWTTFGQTISALLWQMDPLLVGRFVNRFELGGYSMAGNLAALPGQIFVGQVMNPLIVAFSAVREDAVRLAAAYQKSALSITTLGLPVMVGMSMTAEPLLRFAFGEKWLAAAPILRWLPWAIIPTFYTGPLPALAVTLQRVRLLTRLLVIELCVKFPVMLIGIWYYGIAGAVAARVLIALMVAAGSMMAVRELIGLRVRDQLLGSWRPTTSAAIMAAVIASFESAWGDASGLHLPIVVIVGAVVYAGSMFLLWSVAGRPDGLESHIAKGLTSSLQRMRKIIAR
jgi:O-antigen/teichoic acid export membrane protein